MDKLEIQFKELPHSKPIRKFILQKINHWLALHASMEANKVKMNIEFSRAPFNEKIGCYIEAQYENIIWRNFEYGKGLQNTFSKCLKHLNKNTLLERSA